MRAALLLAAAGACLALLGGGLFFGQRRLLYFPTPTDPALAMARAEGKGLHPWLDEQGRQLGWRAPHPSGRRDGILLVLHGNAGDALDRDHVRKAFQAPGIGRALEVVLLEYPGYGPRPGEPSEDGLVRAAEEAIGLLAKEAPLLVLGESLGSAVAVRAAAGTGERVRGLLLVTPFYSTEALVRRHYPGVPAFLLRDTWRADRDLPILRMPVAFLIAERDEVTFPDLGWSLHALCRAPRKVWVDPGGHNSLDWRQGHARWAEILAFLLPQAR